MDPVTSVKTCLRNYVTFSGRATRSEYWWFWLFFFVGSIVLAFLETQFLGFGEVNRGPGRFVWHSNGGPLTGLFALAMVLPMLAAAVRRMHDIGKSGWWLLVALVPFIGTLILLFFLVQPSEPGANAFGPQPMPPLPG